MDISGRWTGKDRVEFLERVLVSDIHSLQPSQGRLTLLCQEDGGIIDDTVITNAGDYQYVFCVWCSNAATRW